MTVVVGITLPGRSIVVGARVDPVFRFKVFCFTFRLHWFNVRFGYLSLDFTFLFSVAPLKSANPLQAL